MAKAEEATQSLTKANNEKSNLLAQIDKYKGLILKNQFEFKLYQQEIQTLRTEL